jgi:hypothetical protein
MSVRRGFSHLVCHHRAVAVAEPPAFAARRHAEPPPSRVAQTPVHACTHARSHPYPRDLPGAGHPSHDIESFQFARVDAVPCFLPPRPSRTHSCTRSRAQSHDISPAAGHPNRVAVDPLFRLLHRAAPRRRRAGIPS